MKHTLLALTLSLASVAPLNSAAAQDQRVYDPQVAFTADQLDNLVAPIALYPDPILAQALIAATFPDQIALAARHVRAYGTRNIDEQPWDVSVKSIAHYPPVLNLLNDREDWTVALGQAYAEQSGEVMDAVQRLRAMARAQGNLNTTPEQTVIVEPRVIRIVPANPRYIYVPTYDYEYVYYRPIFFSAAYHTRYWSFGIGFPIGSWLSYDCDWRYRRVYYDGWYGGGWRVHSRPFIHVSVVYVHPRYEVVHYNRTVVHRYVNYDNVRRYNTVHRTVTYDNRRRPGGPGPLPRGRDDDRGDNDGRRDGDRRDNDGRTDDRRGGDDRGTTDRRDVGTRQPATTETRRAEPRSWERGSTPSRTAVPSPRVETRTTPVTRAPNGTISSRPNAPRVETRSAPVTRAPSGTIYAPPSAPRQPTRASAPAQPTRASAPPQSNRGGNGNGSVSRSSVSRGEARSAPSRSSGSAGPSRSSGSAGPSRSSGSAGPSRSSGSAGPSRSSGSASPSRSSGSSGSSRGSGRTAVGRTKN